VIIVEKVDSIEEVVGAQITHRQLEDGALELTMETMSVAIVDEDRVDIQSKAASHCATLKVERQSTNA
jgi:hypothetical protein